MKKTLDSLHDENVFQVEDLVHLRKVNGLDRVLKPVTASKVIEALDALAALKFDAEGSPQTTMRKQPPPVAAVAVCLSGWLNVSIPAAGQLTRQYLVDPLKADVFVAGTYRAESDCAACLRERLRGLQPIRGLDVATMLTRDELASMMNSSPHFGAVKSAFDVSKTYNSLVGFAHIFSPLLGSGASVLREYHDYSRVLARSVRPAPTTRGSSSADWSTLGSRHIRHWSCWIPNFCGCRRRTATLARIGTRQWRGALAVLTFVGSSCSRPIACSTCCR